MKPVIYIAGPISKGDLEHNIARGNEAMIALMRAGFSPINPMLTCFAGFPHDRCPHAIPCGMTHQDWIGIDLPLVERSDGLLRLSGESLGADMEVAHAQSLGIPVFFDIAILIDGMQSVTRRA